jgi:hypothetical protein
MQVHPAMLMKKKEQLNLSRSTLGNMGGPTSKQFGNWGGPAPTSGPSIPSLQGYPEKFMKTKERRNAKCMGRGELARESPLTMPFPAGEVACEDETNFRSGPRAPCPLSLVPYHKNEGASGDVDENKGTTKFIALNAREYGGADVQTLRQHEGPSPNFWLLDSSLAGISREVYENKGTGKYQVRCQGELARELPLITLFPGGEGASEYETNFQNGPRVPCPVSLAPFQKNAGASGDICENKRQ